MACFTALTCIDTMLVWQLTHRYLSDWFYPEKLLIEIHNVPDRNTSQQLSKGWLCPFLAISDTRTTLHHIYRLGSY